MIIGFSQFKLFIVTGKKTKNKNSNMTKENVELCRDYTSQPLLNLILCVCMCVCACMCMKSSQLGG